MKLETRSTPLLKDEARLDNLPFLNEEREEKAGNLMQRIPLKHQEYVQTSDWVENTRRMEMEGKKTFQIVLTDVDISW
jgi:hypothetical protein